MKRFWFIAILGYSSCAAAMNWMDLWLRADQQGMHLLEQGSPEQAARTFQDVQWQGVAHYRAGHYQQALQQFQQLNTADARYNRGNALALQGDYQAALKEYGQALKLAPQHTDAKYNYNIVKQLLQQQDSQQQSQDNSQSNQPDSKQQQTSSANNRQQRNAKWPSADKHRSKPMNDKQRRSPKQDATEQKHKPGSKNDKQDTATASQNNAIAKNKKQQVADSLKQPSEQTEKARTSSATQQANEQWLRQIPDDPGGLLRQKFLRDYERMRQDR